MESADLPDLSAHPTDLELAWATREGFDVAVNLIAEARYLRYDSHAETGMSWDAYSSEDPDGADALYRSDVRADLLAGMPAIIAAMGLREDARAGFHHGYGDHRVWHPGKTRLVSDWKDDE